MTTPRSNPAPWRATCVQMKSAPVARCTDKDSAWSLIETNVLRAVEAIKRVCDGPLPPKLVVLPEFAFQGPPHTLSPAGWIDMACDTIPGRATAPLQELATKRGIFIAGNLFERDPRWPGRFFNSCFLIGPDGDILLRYRRINTALWPSPHDFMDAYLEVYGLEGTFPVADTELGRLAVIACGEIAVPEVARAFMLRGAEVILHPTNEALGAGQEAAKIARASENMVYLVSANVAGPIGFSLDGSVLGGRSRIVDFRGDTLAYDADTAESTDTTALLDIGALRRARGDLGLANTLLRCRWEMYRSLLGRAAFYPPNRFLTTPMAQTQDTQPVAAAALANLTAAGIAVTATPPATTSGD